MISKKSSCRIIRFPQEFFLSHVHYLKLFILLIFLFSLSINSLFADVVVDQMRTCGIALIPNELQLNRGESIESAYKRAICGNYFNEKTTQTEGQGGVSIGPIDIGGKGKKSQTNITSASICENKENEINTENAFHYFMRYATDNAREYVYKCMKIAMELNATAPIKLSTEFVPPSGIIVSSKWNISNPSEEQPKLIDVKSINLTCSDWREESSYFDWILFRQRNLIPSEGTKNIHCVNIPLLVTP